MTSASAGDVNVPVDNQKPVISNVEYSNVSAAGYTITCTVTDNWSVTKVAFPTWTTRSGQDDLKADWGNTQLGTKSGNRYTFRVNASEHKNETGEYATHIYAWDRNGNMAVLNLPTVQVMNDTTKPVVSNVKISNVTSSGYTVTCKVTDNWGVQKVAFPTWTVANGQDDLAADWGNTQLGTKNGDTYTFQVKTSAHNGEKGTYATHIYAYDSAGNMTPVYLDVIQVP